MQANPTKTPLSLSTQTETTFDNVWGNEMQREDFLALATGVRQISIAQLAFISCEQVYSNDDVQAMAS